MTALENNLYDDDQYSLREGRVTVTALGKLFNIIDVIGAFNNVSWNVLHNIMDLTPLPIYLKEILKNYLFDRKIGISFIRHTTWFDLALFCSYSLRISY